MKEIRCFSCGALVRDIDGPVHRYMESLPGCWAAFGEVLVREYSDVTYAKNHKLTVDAYAVQHPGRPSPQSIQSVAVHLVRLSLVLERGVSQQRATALMQEFIRKEPALFWLSPPADMGSVTVRDVLDAKDARMHLQAVEEWARSAWQAWKEWHEHIRKWAELVT